MRFLVDECTGPNVAQWLSKQKHHTSVPKKELMSGRLDAGSSDPTDGRNKYEWLSKYPDQARKEIRMEAIYLLILCATAIFLIFASWMGWVGAVLNIPTTEVYTFNKYSFFLLAGLLGGVAFDIKYLYRTVARGYWHQDRRVWRLMPPIISMIIALVVGAMISASLLSTEAGTTNPACLAIGFLAGYFADSAVGKMSEIAAVIFGKSAVTKASDGGE